MARDTASPPSDNRAGWRNLAIATVAALTLVVATDLLFAQVAPPKILLEVDDAVALYRQDDPTVLALGSSHARSFTQFDAVARRRTDGQTRIMAVPLEYGKFTGYDWVLQHRLRPLIEERGAQGGLARPALRDLVLIGEWWDATAPGEGRPAMNLPARAWTAREFLADALAHGFTPLNQNYLQQQWRMFFRRSSLVQDFGHGRILDGVKELVRPIDPAVSQAKRETQLSEWRAWLESSGDQINDAEEWAAVERIFSYGRERGLRMTMLLYPRMPSSISEAAREKTFGPFAERMRGVCERFGVNMVDWSWSSPLQDEHFAADIDHVTPEGSALLAEWGLEGDLRYLLEPPASATLGAGSR